MRCHIVGLTLAVRSVIRRCSRCTYLFRRPEQPQPAPLPSFRSDLVLPFTHTGLDYFGPVMIRERSSGIKPYKAYVLLLTCATTRAVHLELTDSLDTDDLRLALRRFIARRGVPSILYSDNGKSLLCAAKELKAVQRELSRLAGEAPFEPITWKFSLAYCPWQGGFFERMVGSVKRALKKVSDGSVHPRKLYVTMLAEAEAVVNSRPLCASPDPSAPPLTPALLLIGRPLLSTPQYTEHLFQPPTKNPKAALATCALRAQFLRRWHGEYLLALRGRFMRNEDPALRLGELVLIEEPISRSSWSTGQVIRLQASSAGVVRSCTVRAHGVEYDLPLQRLVRLEAWDA